jgi:hypothetical protein
MAVYPDWPENAECKFPKLFLVDWRCKLVGRGRPHPGLSTYGLGIFPYSPFNVSITYNYCLAAIQGERPKPRNTAPQHLFNVVSTNLILLRSEFIIL